MNINVNKLTVEQRVQKAHVWLMKHPKYCLYSGIFMLGTVKVSNAVPTACTDGRNVVYGREFMENMPDVELRAVILHENLHKAFRHLSTWRHLYAENAPIANMACDYVINLLIHETDKDEIHVRLPKCGLLDSRYAGWDSQRVYKDLLRQAQDKGSVTVRTVGNQGGREVPTQDIGAGSMDEHQWDAADGMTDEAKEALGKEVDQALRQGVSVAKKLGGVVPREVQEALESRVDWRDVLREFLTANCADKDSSSWRRPARRWVSEGVYMPSAEGEACGRVVVAIDTSGSIDSDILAQFLGEVQAICAHVRPEGVDLLYWDSRVVGHETYDRDALDTLVSSTCAKGGGGTAPSCVTRYMAERKMRPECCVMLTDGYVAGDWGGDWPCPVLWGITTRTVAPVGTTVRVA